MCACVNELTYFYLINQVSLTLMFHSSDFSISYYYEYLINRDRTNEAIITFLHAETCRQALFTTRKSQIRYLDEVFAIE